MTSSELLDQYLQARTALLASRDVAPGNFRLPIRAAEIMHVPGDTLRAWLSELEHRRLVASLPDPLETLTITSWEKIAHLRVALHRGAFDSTEWAFTGSNSRSAIDTMRTADLRSRLQSVFGAPTVTLAESPSPDSLMREQVIQFEYWFVLNEDIKVVVIDVNGPWDRGVVVAADYRYRSDLSTIKRDFLEQLIPEADRKPFTDYYYNVDQNTWYLTGFDGASFFDRRIERPNMSLGRPAPVIQQEPEPSTDPNELQ
ncbi:MAG: hypothetical protein OXT73_11465 [Bacteroidota bacterium]|nr:hypothetical protein [Bacteroidota bacterium]